MNMSCVIHFIQILEKEIAEHPKSKIAYLVEDGQRAMTNAVFLLGAYMIIRQNATIEVVMQSFEWLDSSYIESYRDATYEGSDFDLSLVDCWRALLKGKSVGWLANQTNPDDNTWGDIDVDEYDHYDDPLNGDLHIVVPGRFIAFKGPMDLSGREYLDDARGVRSFSPHYYVDIFRELGVTAVVRLNEPEYQAQTFTAHGIRHYDLQFEDCTVPPQDIVRGFLRVLDQHKTGLIAVHCKAGLGRTGTLIALCLMRSHGFSAREAIAWLRIMRPGSVIGAQQRYLCSVDAAVQDIIRRGANGPAPPPPARPSASFTYGAPRRLGSPLAQPPHRVAPAGRPGGESNQEPRSRSGESSPEPRSAAAEAAAQVSEAMDRRNAVRAGSSFRGLQAALAASMRLGRTRSAGAAVALR